MEGSKIIPLTQTTWLVSAKNSSGVSDHNSLSIHSCHRAFFSPTGVFMIPHKFEFFVFTFLMSLFMSFFMSGVITFINMGLVEGFTGLWMEAFGKAFVVAYPTIMIVVPQVRRIVKLVVRHS